MTDMIERVARAIGDAIETAGQPGHLRTQRPDRDVLMMVARAVIAAMREPTDETVERAGRAALCGWNNVADDNATMAAEWERMGPATREAWMRAMRRGLSAALSEGDKL